MKQIAFSLKSLMLIGMIGWSMSSFAQSYRITAVEYISKESQFRMPTLIRSWI